MLKVALKLQYKNENKTRNILRKYFLFVRRGDSFFAALVAEFVMLI